jgi:altronate dehydratase small subunit
MLDPGAATLMVLIADPAGETDPRLLLLDERDNVLVVTARIRAGETITVSGRSLTAAADLPLGHKLARRDIAAGEKVVKYGAPIGSATSAIRAGEHAHVHNIKSDYTPTYHLEDVKTQYGSAP